MTLTDEEAAGARQVLTAIAEHLQAGGTLPRCMYVEFVPVLPPDYKLKPGACDGYWVERPDGSFIRHDYGAPKWYPTRKKAIEAAIEDVDLALEAHKNKLS